MIELLITALVFALGLWFLVMPIAVAIIGGVIGWRQRDIPYVREPWRWYR